MLLMFTVDTVNNFARYHDLLCQDKDYTGEARFIRTLLRKYSPNARSILEVNCGTGYRSLLLAESGYERIHGIDRDAERIDRGRERLQAVPLEIARKLRFDRSVTVRFEERFDVAFSLFHAINYPLKMGSLQAIFTAVKKHLSPEGTFVFDCWYGPPVLADLPAVRVKRLEVEEILLDRATGFGDSLDREFTRYQIENALEELQNIHPTRYWFERELEDLFDRTGLQLIDRALWMHENIAGFDTWGIYFIGKV
ncbi:class I SAM-dependent methyltransferase [Pannus brasiliensis CCIBt3594]|uniref:Class I SAM-dependent methyltransferase n=1 Tax=Pannus brasiliensis CCIBt3594 TaxID=1427578 RepID=A0AAW9QV88_9CHRO